MIKTKILCTIGPASNSEETIREMAAGGMNAARLNTSHGDFEQYRTTIERIRRVADIPIIMDTQGPKVRLRMKHSINLKAGYVLRVGFHSGEEYYLDTNIYNELAPGDHAMIDDGNFEAVIEEKDSNSVAFRFKNGGSLISGRAVNFPGKALPLAALTEKDIQSLQFAREMNIDYVALSFTRNKEDILACRSRLEGSEVKIIAKIENQQGIDRFDEILERADGIMIARGDMGVELPPQEVPIVQKRLIRSCLASGRLVITATQMLQSMIDNPRPTRAEISDVANAVLDGTDVVMLSGETAAGKYPIDAVRMMASIARSAEPFVHFEQPAKDRSVETAICDSVHLLCDTAHVDKIVTVTRRGRTAKMISRLRVQQPIFALTSKETAFRELHLHFGITPVLYENLPDSIRMATAGMYLHLRGYIQESDTVLFVSGEYNPTSRSTNTLQIITMKEIIDYCRDYGIPN